LSFFEELKRRNVFRVGIAYVIGGWLLLQLTDVLSQLLALPEVVGRVIVLLVAIGLPVTLFFAWAFEMTPEGIKKEKDVDRSKSITQVTGQKLNNTIIGILVVALAYFAVDKFVLAPGRAHPGSDHLSEQAAGKTTKTGEKSALTPVEATAQAETEAEPIISKQSIAVLPFDNRSNREEDQFFTDGIHDDLLTTIARIGSMKVISRTSVMEYKNTTKKLPEIAKELGVANILEGGIQRSGNKVRINVQLIDAETDEHLWAEIFDRELTTNNLFDIQSEISKAIADALEATLTDQEEQLINRRPTENLAAYNAYMLARQLLPKRTSSALQQAREEFERAVKLDPGFALAWVGVADSAMLQSDYGTLGIDESLEIQQTAIDRAMEIDPQLGEAYASQGQIYSTQSRWSQAENSYRRAIELSPNYATAYHWYANHLSRKPSRLRESLSMSETASELDPLSTIIRSTRGWVLEALGEFDQAERVYTQLIEMNPDFARVYAALSNMLSTKQGRYDKAYQLIKKSQAIDAGNMSYLGREYQILMAVGAIALADESSRRMEELDDKHLEISLRETLRSLKERQFAAAREQATYLSNSVSAPFAQWFAGRVFALDGQYEQARDLLLSAEPAYIDRGQWTRLFEERKDDACMVGWVLMNTQDEKLGRELVEEALTYLEETLPQYIKHADIYSSEVCYAALGDMEATLDSLQQRVAHNHINFWWALHVSPLMRSILDHPRFIELDQKVNEELARQRTIIESIAAENGAGI